MAPPVLVIHGGTGARPDRRRLDDIRRRLRAIAEEAYAYLAGHSAVEGVTFAVERLEDDPLFNAGTGSVLQADGVARMSASVMDGARLRFAGVLNIERVDHPVDVARALLKETDRVLAGHGATQFATRLGIGWCSDRKRPSHSHRQAPPASGWHDTVGAVALDRAGRLAAATSTGGKQGQGVGRVSDSGLPIGNYANRAVAVSCTGIGEEIIEEGVAVWIAQRLGDGRSLPQAFAGTFRALRMRHRRIGAIALDRSGRFAVSTTLPVIFAMTQLPHRQVESF